MAAPQLLEAEMKVPDRIILSFDQPLDPDAQPPLSSYSINYGKVPLVGMEFWGTSKVVLRLLRRMEAQDKLEVNYQPPDDPNNALRAPVPDGANMVVIRRNVVRAFFKVPVKNLLKYDEIGWNTDANLGPSDSRYVDQGDPHDHYLPDGDRGPCGNGHTHGDAVGTGDLGGALIATPTGTGGNGKRSAGAGYYNYPISTRPNPRTANPDDFILAYGLKEAIQLTNIDNSDATEPNTDKLWMAIQDACALIDNYIVQASRGGKLLISSNRRRTALIIARYYLDTIRRREDVKEDYERSIKEIERAMSMEDVVRPDQPWWQDPCNPLRACGVRSHRIPQYYNGVSGKGLSGWWKDSAFVERDDFRYSRLNSEANNNEPNRKAGVVAKDGDPRLPAQPADDGGIRYSGTSSSAP